jgi:hypothetical protein
MAARQLQVNSLTQSGGTITAVLNGQTYTVAVSGLVANSLYMIYFTSAGLVVSQNVNSVGPGTAGWKLVGAFYSSGTAFGNFVTIRGKPESLWVPFSSNAAGAIVSAATNPTYGTIINNVAKWKRSGTEWLMEWDIAWSSAGTGSNTPMFLNVPTNIALDLSQKPASPNTAINTLSAYSSVGLWQGLYPGNNELNQGLLIPHSANQLRFAYAYNGTNTGAFAGITTVFTFTTGSFSTHASAPIVGWTNTPLEDL